MPNNCASCNHKVESRPSHGCSSTDHWKAFALKLEERMKMHDDDRDLLDTAEWLQSYPKTRDYKCHGCGRQYDLPRHIDHFTCICGHRVRLRHLGGINPQEELIDAAISYFGNERSANLAWIAEVAAGSFYKNASSEEIRQSIQRELDRWEMTKRGWQKKKSQ